MDRTTAGRAGSLDLASAHGARESTYLLTNRMTSIAELAARSSLNPSIADSNSAFRCWMAAMTSGSGSAFGTIPSLNLCAMERERLRALPRSLARSLL